MKVRPNLPDTQSRHLCSPFVKTWTRLSDWKGVTIQTNENKSIENNLYIFLIEISIQLGKIKRSMSQNSSMFSTPIRHRGDFKANLWDVTGGVTFQWDGCKCFLNILISVADKNIYPFKTAQWGVGLLLPMFWYANTSFFLAIEDTEHTVDVYLAQSLMPQLYVNKAKLDVSLIWYYILVYSKIQIF